MNFEQDIIISRIKEHLTNIKIDSDKFLEIIKKYKVSITGSIVLQAIVNKHFEYSDIDLCVLDDRNSELEKEIESLTDGKFYNINSLEVKESNNEIILNYENVGILSVSTLDYKINLNLCGKIQIIYIDKTKHITLDDFIDTFDFDICKNYTDGEKVVIKNPEAIKGSTGTINIYENKYIFTERNIARIIKYYKRGFDIKVNFIDKNIIYDVMVLIGQCNQSAIKNYANLLIFVEPKKIIPTNLPIELENLIIYYYHYDTEIDNLPIALKNLIIYDEQYKLRKRDIDNTNKYKKVYNKIKLPFDCKLLVNGKLFE
jgi:hypothetical protein